MGAAGRAEAGTGGGESAGPGDGIEMEGSWGPCVERACMTRYGVYYSVSLKTAG